MIPRGGEGLIRAVVEAATMPVLKHYKGVCHIYVDAERGPGPGRGHRANAKMPAPRGVQRPGVPAGAPGRGPGVPAPAWPEPWPGHGVAFRACPRPCRSLGPTARPATDEDWGLRVPGPDPGRARGGRTWTEALAHIAKYGLLLQPHRVHPDQPTTAGPCASCARPTPPWWASTAPPASTTAASSAWARRSASAPPSSTPTVPWASKNSPGLKFVVLGQGQVQGLSPWSEWAFSGGAFNPVHVGHLRLGVEALECRGPGQGWSWSRRPGRPTSPSRGCCPSRPAANCSELAVAGMARLFREPPGRAERPGPSYTWDTLEALCPGTSTERERPVFHHGRGGFSEPAPVEARPGAGHGWSTWWWPPGTTWAQDEVAACLAGQARAMGCQSRRRPGRMAPGRRQHPWTLIDYAPRLDISASRLIRERHRRGAGPAFPPARPGGGGPGPAQRRRGAGLLDDTEVLPHAKVLLSVSQARPVSRRVLVSACTATAMFCLALSPCPCCRARSCAWPPSQNVAETAGPEAPAEAWLRAPGLRSSPSSTVAAGSGWLDRNFRLPRPNSSGWNNLTSRPAFSGSCRPRPR